MALLLDTDRLEARERAEAVAAAMADARQPGTLRHAVDSPLDVHARLDLWSLGGDLTLMRVQNSALRLTRGPRQVRAAEVERIGLTLLSPGRWRHVQGDLERVERTDRWELLLVDHDTPYDFTRVGDSTTYAFAIDHADLRLPVDLVRKAAGRIAGSPLEQLVIDHLLGVGAALAGPGPGLGVGAGALLGSATAELLRALILAAAGGPVAEPPVASLLVRSRRYVADHLTEHDLTPARIARAHQVSVRQLYAAWAGSTESLAGHVMAQRLLRARQALAISEARGWSIAAVARSCGFVDAAHFARRFRGAYGVSPREYRRALHDGNTAVHGQDSCPAGGLLPFGEHPD